MLGFEQLVTSKFQAEDERTTSKHLGLLLHFLFFHLFFICLGAMVAAQRDNPCIQWH